MSNVLENSILGFCKWDILALIVLAVAVVVFEVRQRKLKKKTEGAGGTAFGDLRR